MRILILSFYFEPDLSAGSFRAAALIRALQAMLPPDSHIDVVTTLPNRYASFGVKAKGWEETSNLTVRRLTLPRHRSRMRDQSRAFLAYAKGVRAHVRDRNYDLVFATSSRLMTAVLGAWVARNLKAPLYLDIRDIFADTIGDVLPKWLAVPLTGFFSGLEVYAIRAASKVNLVSRGFEPYFRERYPRTQFTFFPNGIDEEFTPCATEKSQVQPGPPYSVLYAGNIGEGQGLHKILPGLARAMRGKASFTVIGDGGRKDQLKEATEAAGVDNLVLLDPMDRVGLAKAYQDADVLFLHLNDHAALRKVLPSKLFEYAATGKPIWAGVSGYAAGFIRQEVDNAAVFPPCDVKAAAEIFSSLSLQPIMRASFARKYARRSIMEALAADLLATRRPSSREMQ